MFKRKILYLFILSLFSSYSAFADNSNPLECNKNYSLEDAKQLIEEVQEKYQEIKSLHANFIQYSYLAAVDMQESSSGEVWLSKPSKMKWQYLVPEEQLFLMNNQTLWYYQPLDRQVLIQNFSDVVLTDLPVAFLLGIGDLRKDFKLEKACSNENGVVLDLSPVENDLKKQELDGFRLLINQELKFPSGAEIIHLGGNKTSIILDNLKLQEKIDDSVYEASFPKGVDVNDMRK